MYVFRPSALAALAGLLLLGVSAGSEPEGPAKPNPFFSRERAYPVEDFGPALQGFPQLPPVPVEPFGSFGPRSGLFEPARWASSSSMADISYSPVNDYGGYFANRSPYAQMQQVMSAQQAYQAWLTWKQARSMTPARPLLPGQGGTTGVDACTPGAHLAMLYAPGFGGTRQPGFVPAQCFVRGTEVHLGDEAGQLCRIEDVKPGQRLQAIAHTNPADDGPAVAILAASWRQVQLRAIKGDGSHAEMVLLRPVEWLEAHRVQVGGRVNLLLPGCGWQGPAEVCSIGPCPSIPGGRGPVVTGTVRHAAARIVDLHLEGLGAPIGTTANHRFWSEDRQCFVRADELSPGEQLRGLAGQYRVVRLESRSVGEAVYNLEVPAAGAYLVSPLGIVARDAGSWDQRRGPAGR